MNVKSGIRLIFLLAILVIQFLTLITFINQYYGKERELSRAENKLQEVQRSKEALEFEVQRTLSDEINNSRKTETLQRVDEQATIKPNQILIEEVPSSDQGLTNR